MRIHRIMGVVCAAAVLVTGGMAMSAQAASYLKSYTHTDAFEMQGQRQPPQTDTSETWLAGNRAALVSAGGQSFVLRADEGKMYFIDRPSKTYTELSLDMFSGFGDDSADESADDAGPHDIFRDMKLTVTPTEETAKIAGFNTTKYMVELTMPMGSTESETWVTKDIDVNYDVYRAISNAAMAQIPGFKKIIKEMEKIDGVTVKNVTTANIGGSSVQTTTEVLEYAEKPAPDSLFIIPDGYTERSMAAGSVGP
jgi:hypothetical protein